MSSASSCAGVGLIGYGAIGRQVGEALAAARVPHCELAGTLTRRGTGPKPARSLDELLDRCDVVVEAAGPAALTEHGPRVVGHGTELLLVSVGAMVDPTVREAFRAGPGRVEVSSGAIGGFDALRAANLEQGLDAVRLTTTKPPASLHESWMSVELRARLEVGGERIVVFEGTAAEAVVRFPASVNVAATLALATLGLERTQVRVVAEPEASHNEHRVEASGPAGSYELRFRNRPSAANPRSSRLTALAVQRRLGERASRLVVGT